MERLGKPRHGREGRRLSEREVSESNPAAEPYVRFAGSLDFARDDSRKYANRVQKLLACVTFRRMEGYS